MDEFRRDLFDPEHRATGIGAGEIGGKARGLLMMQDVLKSEFPGGEFSGIAVNIPAFTVLRTDVFDSFLQRNHLQEIAYSDAPDDSIALEFQKAALPAEILGDLRGLIEKVHTPLAIRSSSLLEDSLQQPFAGVYLTKMLPNNQPDSDSRFRKLTEAIKLVYASAFFQASKDYIHATGRNPNEEKMAIVIQEVVGRRFSERFYPQISGVGRSYHFYATGRVRPEHGVVSLALGLGKTIVDGGTCWTYSPAFPTLAPPMSAADLLQQTQTRFWSVNMGRAAYDPIHETEYLLHLDVPVAESDGVLQLMASTYDPQSDRFTPGVARVGPRVLDFAGILRFKELPLNDLIRKLLDASRAAQGGAVEIEFALTLHPHRLGFLQARPMMVDTENVELREEELHQEGVVVASENVLGNGRIENIRDIVYVKPESFEAGNTQRIAMEVESINRRLLQEKRPYVLIGFGRWGSSDPWLGIPVQWGQVSGAKVIVETMLPRMNVEFSQGSHFFHNLLSFKVSYLAVPHEGEYPIRWDRLSQLPPAEETESVRHVTTDQPLQIVVDGTRRRGVIVVR